MPLHSNLLLAAAAVCCFTAIIAFPMDSFATNKCQCLTTSSDRILPRHFQRIEILPPRAHCRKIEILITKKDNKTICINPEAKWINNMIMKVMSKRAVKETALPTTA